MKINTVTRCQECGVGFETTRHWNCPICGCPRVKEALIDADPMDLWTVQAMDAENDFRNLQVADYRKQNG